jgi:hypothetical protein
MNNSDTLDLKNILNNPTINNSNSDSNNKKEKDETNINISLTTSNTVIYKPRLGNIFELLDTHNNNITKKPWSKLDKSNKVKILNNFIEKEKTEKSLSQDTVKQLKTILHKALYNNLLNKQQDIVYDSDKKIIVKINSLQYNLETKTYAIKFKDKSSSRVTSKSKTNVDRLISSNNKRKK